MIGRLGGVADAGQHDFRSNPFPLAPVGAGAHPQETNHAMANPDRYRLPLWF